MLVVRPQPGQAATIGTKERMPIVCSQCKVPACADACPVEALKKTEDLVELDRELCISCLKCVDACPMNLVPTKIALASRHQDIALSRRYNIMACFECGSCAFTCPASIPLVQLVRTGKAQVIASQRK